MIDTFKKGIYHTYSFDNENTIKMNDSMMHIFSLCRLFCLNLYGFALFYFNHK